MKIPDFKHVGTLNDIWIYLMLRKAENPITKTATISIKTLAEQSGMSLNTIRTIIVRLEAIGWINVVRRTTQAHIYIFPINIEYLYEWPDIYFDIDQLEPELKTYLFCLYNLATESKDGVRILPWNFNIVEHLNISKYKSNKFNSILKKHEILIKTYQIKDEQIETIYLFNLNNALNEK